MFGSSRCARNICKIFVNHNNLLFTVGIMVVVGGVMAEVVDGALDTEEVGGALDIEVVVAGAADQVDHLEDHEPLQVNYHVHTTKNVFIIVFGILGFGKSTLQLDLMVVAWDLH